MHEDQEPACAAMPAMGYMSAFDRWREAVARTRALEMRIFLRCNDAAAHGAELTDSEREQLRRLRQEDHAALERALGVLARTVTHL